MKNKIIFFLALFLNSAYLFSQVPGYMGKRCTIAYSVWAHPSIKDVSDFFGGANPHEDISLNVTQAAELDYIVARRGALCLGFQYAYLAMGYNDDSYPEYVYRGKENFPARLISRGFSLGYKLFPRARIAPVGTYLKWDVVGFFNTLKYSTEGVSQNVYVYSSSWTGTSGYQLVPIKKEIVRANAGGGGVAFSLGRQRVFADRIILDTGVRFAFAVAGEPGTGYGNKFKVAGRVFFNQFVNFRLGIGFLAF